jgi:hypothetical protein
VISPADTVVANYSPWSELTSLADGPGERAIDRTGTTTGRGYLC